MANSVDECLQLRLFGPPTITLGEISLMESLSGKAQAILYYLVVTGQAQPRLRLASLLWGDLPEPAARANLRRALVDLRQTVGDYLDIERQSVGFTAGESVWADVVELTSGIEAASFPVNVERLQKAVELYRGDFLVDFYVRDAPDFESWAAAERERLRGLVIQALYTLAEHHTKQGEWSQGVAFLRRVLALEPWREEAHRQLMLLLARSGQRSAALAQFESCRQILEEELGVEPGAETTRLYERIRDEDLSSAGKFGSEEGPDQVIAQRFEIQSLARDLVGQGGMGQVYRGRDNQTDAPVAIKMLKPEFVAGSTEMIERFVREGEALRQADHPNIVKLIAAVEEADQHYLVMEYVGGGSLRDLLARQAILPLKRVVALALELADALARAHHLNIIHRDLKPANILLTADGTPRLTDFGLAHLATHPQMTQTGVVLGTVDYLSPEGCNGEKLDARADIWSFGVLLYEMLSGERPFSRGNLAATMAAILAHPTPSLTEHQPDVPPALVSLIERMLAKDPDQRLPSMRLIAAELEAILANRAISPVPPLADTGQGQVERLAGPTPGEVEAPPHNLPLQTTPFLGRSAEVAELNRLLAEPNLRLVTILGPGGMGKTRLAQEAAAGQRPNFAHGVYFVSLAPIEATDSLVPTIAEALDFSFYEGGTPQQQLLDYLRSKTMLLILDNFEHLLMGVNLVTEILQTAPGVRILATSRERLKLRDEQLFHLAGIDFPAPETLVEEVVAKTSAVKLFLRSARRVQPDFGLAGDDLAQVAGICRLVQGMPLAILLAAAWVEMLTPAEIAAELGRSLDLLETDLRDVPDRHHSMRAVFDHSWRLLSEPEREIFQRLSVFRGGFTRQAAQEVAGASLQSLRSLLNKSLLQPAAAGRYQLHALLRQYAAEKLAQTPLAYQATRDRHCAHYTAILNEWETDFAGPRQQLALAELDEEIKNIRSAWNWAVRQGKPEEIDLALESLYQFYWIRSRFQEGQEAFSRAAERLQADNSAPAENVLTRLLARQGAFCYSLGRHDAAEALLQTSLSMARQLDAKKEMAFALRVLGDVAGDLAEYPTATQRFQESLTISQKSGDQADRAAALFGLGGVSYSVGKYPQAKHFYQESLALYRRLDSQLGITRVLDKLGMIAFAEGQYSESEQFYRESQALFKEIGDRLGVAQTLGGVGLAAWGQGEDRLAEVKRLYEESLTICRDIGHRFMTVMALAWLGQINNGVGAYQAAQQYFREAVTLTREMGLREPLAWSLNGFSEAACGLGDFQSARQYLFESLTIAIDIQVPFDALEALVYWATLLIKDDLPPHPDPTRAARLERVLELLALAINHPGNLQYVRDKAARLMADLEADLFPEIVVAAIERGKARDLWATAEAVRAEIEAGLAGQEEKGQKRRARKLASDAREASIRVASSLPAPVHNLPANPTPLIGREKELSEINDLMADPDCRLLTLVGPGGIGKTRLSIEAAGQALAQFASGVYFVSLASTDSVEDILPRIATAVDPETYPTGQAAANFVPQLHQRDPAMLLVLDNLEQLLPEGSAAIEALLTQTHQLKLIVTSREALNIRWEWRYDLDGLAYPADDTAGALESYSAVKMFLERLRHARREPLAETEVQAVARICHLVGGMPLGIELAAAQAARLSVVTIATALAQNLDTLVVSLQDLPTRQRSLRASFELTWANLPPDEQAVFRCLSLFRSSFTAAAAQAVAETGPLSLITLIDKSLLRQVSPERYDLHPVVRHYAQEKLAEVPADQAQALRRYRNFYTAFLLERAAALEHHIDLTKNMAEFYIEIDNLWAGWAQIIGYDDAQDFASALVRGLQATRHAQFLLSSDTVLILEHQQQLLESRSSQMDVCQIDLIWTDTLADHLLDLSQDFTEEIQSYFSIYIETNTVADRLIALPVWTDLGLLHYRADLLAKYGFAAPPATWDELEVMAAEIQAGERAAGRPDFWGFVWQGANYEGLTCNALEWQASHGGGQLIEPDEVITVNNPHTIAAFERAARWVGTISPSTVTETTLGDEAASDNIWKAGNAAFMRAWNGFFPAGIRGQEARVRFGVTLLPSGGAGTAATLGGHGMAVSKYARYPREAIELVRYATGREAQLQRVISPPFWSPTIPDLYDQREVVAIHPHFPKIKDIFSSGKYVTRPSKVCGKLYPQVSRAYSTAVHSILTGQVDAATAVADLESKLVEITGFEVGPAS